MKYSNDLRGVYPSNDPHRFLAVNNLIFKEFLSIHSTNQIRIKIFIIEIIDLDKAYSISLFSLDRFYPHRY